MTPELHRLMLEQLERTLAIPPSWASRRAPAKGWLRTIRAALGLSGPQQAKRLGVTTSALYKSEQSEADERITLQQLRKLADSLDCDLVYALVPRRPLTEVVDEQAKRIASEEIERVANSMELEDQRPSPERLRKQVEDRAQELLRGSWSNLWR